MLTTGPHQITIHNVCVGQKLIVIDKSGKAFVLEQIEVLMGLTSTQPTALPYTLGERLLSLSKSIFFSLRLFSTHLHIIRLTTHQKFKRHFAYPRSSNGAVMP